MKVLVLEHPRIRSQIHFNDIANTPLWSCLMSGYVTASLRKAGVDVSLLDANAFEWDFSRTDREVVERIPDLLCIHAVYFWEHTTQLFDFFLLLRSLGFTGHLNLFGFFPTLGHEIILKHAAVIDSIAVGESELTLAELALSLNQGVSWYDIPGLAYRRRNGNLTLISREPDREPDRFPFPDRDLRDAETVSVLASRGCYNHCRFCPIPVFYNNGPRWRGRTPESVAHEIHELRGKGVSDFYFVDPNFIGPGQKGKKRTMELCRLLQPLGITFGIETRAADIDAELLASLKSAGLKSLLIGIESGSPDVLNDLNKRASIETSESAIALCRANGIEPEVGFLMFVPDSRIEDLATNLAFLKRNRLLDRLDRTANLLCHRQIVFMGTTGYQRFQAQGRIGKTGFLGFQAEIEYRDLRVKRISDVVVSACHLILEEMSCEDSILHFDKNKTWDRFKTLNNYLVDLFESLLTEASGADGYTQLTTFK